MRNPDGALNHPGEGEEPTPYRRSLPDELDDGGLAGPEVMAEIERRRAAREREIKAGKRARERERDSPLVVSPGDPASSRLVRPEWRPDGNSPHRGPPAPMAADPPPSLAKLKEALQRRADLTGETFWDRVAAAAWNEGIMMKAILDRLCPKPSKAQRGRSRESRGIEGEFARLRELRVQHYVEVEARDRAAGISEAPRAVLEIREERGRYGEDEDVPILKDDHLPGAEVPETLPHRGPPLPEIEPDLWGDGESEGAKDVESEGAESEDAEGA